MTQRKLAKVLVFILLSVIIVTSSSRLLPPVAGANWTVTTQLPTRVLDPGQTVSVKVIVKQDVVSAFMHPNEHFMVEEVAFSISRGDESIAYFSRDYNRRVELIRDFILPITIDANAEPGHYQFTTIVEGTIYAQPKLPLTDHGTVWIRGEEERNITETLGTVSVTIKAVFPTIAEAGETITGQATIIPDPTIQVLGGVFTLDSSVLTIRPLGFSKEIAPAGTNVRGARTFNIPVPIPVDAEPGVHSWSASATATGRALGMEETRTVAVSGSLIVKERAPSEEDLECIIATAAFGSKMDANVEAMRNLRDGSVKITFTGSNFMRVFNGWYYSWSPRMAEIIHGNEALRQVTRFVLYPVVGSVMAAQGTYSMLSFNGELAATTSILTAAFICGVFYIAPLILVIRSIKQRLGRINSLNMIKHLNIMLILFAVLSISLTIIGGIANSAVLNAIGVTVLALTITLYAATLTVKVLTKINRLSTHI
jgi:hypothetical protein